MKIYLLAAGVAAFAMSAPLAAQGKGHGGHGDHGGQKAEHGHKGGRDMKGRGGDDRGHGMRIEARGRDQDRGDRRDWSRDDRGMAKVKRDDDRRDWNDNRDDDDMRRAGMGLARNNGWVDGCPPGLAKKDNGCLPPGLAKKIVGTAVPSAWAQSTLTGPYGNWYRDDNQAYYRQNDGMIYRINRQTGLVDAMFPAQINNFGYYPVGMNFPADYNYYNVPTQYQSLYPAAGDMAYRYANGAIYSVDPTTSAVRSIVALLAGDLSVGQPLPSAYSVYNVPMSYRGQYYDTPDNMYRYNDGYIYRVDPKTQLVTAVVSALLS